MPKTETFPKPVIHTHTIVMSSNVAFLYMGRIQT